LLGEHRNYLAKWFESMRDEVREFSLAIQKCDLGFVERTKLFAILKERLETVKEDENLIFFIPYPLVKDSCDSFFLVSATDFLQAIYNKLNEGDLIGERRVFFIYPSIDSGVYILRDGYYHREYLSCNKLDDLVAFQTSLKRWGDVDNREKRKPYKNNIISDA
jgi:hypothetical protein